MSLYDFLVDFFYYCTTEKNFSNRDSKGVWNAQELAIICSKHLFISETVILPTIWQGWLRFFETFFSQNKIFFVVFLRNNFCVYTNKYWFDFDFFWLGSFFWQIWFFFWKLLDGFEQPDEKNQFFVRTFVENARRVASSVFMSNEEISKLKCQKRPL